MSNSLITISKLLVLGILLIISIGMLFLAIRQLELSRTKMTTLQKIKKSLIMGCGVTSLILLLFSAVLTLMWDGSMEWSDLSALLTFGVCFLVPVQVIATIGGFIQITYLEILAGQIRK